MSYTITLRNKNMYQLDDDDAWSLKDTLAKAKGSIMVELGEDMVRSGEIVNISRNKLTAADLPTFDSDRLLEDKRCKGKYSIQNEINRIIKDEHPRDWAKKIADKSFREKLRIKLRQQKDVLWCDYRAEECAC